MRVSLTYIWLDPNDGLRYKKYYQSVGEDNKLTCPPKSFDGSSTGQASATNSDVYLMPVALYVDPWKPPSSRARLVLCEVFETKEKPHESNIRAKAREAMEEVKNLEPRFGFEQEFFAEGKDELEEYHGGGDQSTQAFYCGVGSQVVKNPEFHMACESIITRTLDSVTGFNVEVAPRQFEYQVDNRGLKAADDLIILRYLLTKEGENHGIRINYADPKPYDDLNGSGLHTNFSYKGIDLTYKKFIEVLGERHAKHMEFYGNGNEKRMTGEMETSRFEEFSYGDSDRTASVRVPILADPSNFYIEDRRPASSANPYHIVRLFSEALYESVNTK